MKNQFIAITLATIFHFTLTAMAQPVTTTLSATGITSTNATLNGSVNPNGAVTSAYFQFGLTTNYDSESTFVEFPATNVTLAMPGVMAASLRGAAGTNWIQTGAPSGSWNGIASSADGTRLAAAASGGGIYTSTNSGISWELTSAPNGVAWQWIASSADGTRLAAVVNDHDSGGIYTSTNGGATWTETSAGPNQWYSIASSADGTRLVASVDGNGGRGGIYSSANGGATWTQSGMFIGGNWQSIASSADGTHVAVADDSGGIGTSTDGGITWTATSAPGANWVGIASSADGMRLTAVNYDIGGIFISADGGNTWTQTSAPYEAWQSVASSADGRRLTAGTYNSSIWTSMDSGAIWTEGNAPARTWIAIASSSDGSHLAAAVYGGGIYTSLGAVNPLSAGTTYHYRAVGVNSAGTSYGNDLTFTTTGTGAPTATTLQASGNSGTNATLNGSLLTGGLNTSVYFQYGLTANYGSYSATNIFAGTNVVLSVSNLLNNLTAGATYHFQLVASNGAGTSMGGDISFVTPILAPIVTTLPATSIISDSATLNGLINPNGAATLAYFQYGLTTNYGGFSTMNTVAVTNDTFALADMISNSLPGTIWVQTGLPVDNWICVASSADGTHLAAASFVQGGASGLIYTSTNSGSTWAPSSAPVRQCK